MSSTAVSTQISCSTHVTIVVTYKPGADRERSGRTGQEEGTVLRSCIPGLRLIPPADARAMDEEGTVLRSCNPGLRLIPPADAKDRTGASGRRGVSPRVSLRAG